MWQEMGRRKGRDSRHGEGDTANIYFKGKGPAIEVVAHLSQQVIWAPACWKGKSAQPEMMTQAWLLDVQVGMHRDLERKV